MDELKNKKDKKKEQPLYIIEYENTVDEATISGEYYPSLKKSNFIVFFVYSIIVNFFFSFIAQLFLKNGIKVFICAEIMIVVYYLINNDKVYKKTASSVLKKRKNNTIVSEFYKDYFTREINNIIYKVYYKDIIDGIETQTHIFIRIKKLQIYTINKSFCEPKAIDFIRTKINKLDSRLGEEIKFKPTKKAKRPGLLNVMMIMLFILSIMCFPLSFCVHIINEIINSASPVCCKWIYLCFIIIPLISIIFSFVVKNNRYENVKIDYKLNIISGIIMIVFLFLLGYNYVFPYKADELNKDYKKIAQVEFPNKTLQAEEKFIGIVDEKEKWEYTFIMHNFTKKDAEKFEKQIKISDKWLLNPKLDADYIIDRPFHLKIDDNTYILNYNSSTKEYNTFSKETGNYYIITYNIKSRHLEIHKYYYLKRKEK